MTRANAAKEKASRLAAQRHAPAANSEQEPDEQPAPAVTFAPMRAPEPNRKNVRLTLDLVPALYDDFEDWRRDAAKRLGRGRVTSSDVLRVLLRQLMADEELAAAVVEALRREGGR